MDMLKGKLGGSNQNTAAQGAQGTQETGGGLMGGVNNAMGGGQAGEKNEDFLDKGVDFAQERMGQGPQNNESAMEQAKDEKISDTIRDAYKKGTGSDFPVADKS